MTANDVPVAPPQNEDQDAERPEGSVAEQLVEQARAEGVDLVGPGGLLTKQILETGLEVEMEEHLGYENTPLRDATAATVVTGPDRKR